MDTEFSQENKRLKISHNGDSLDLDLFLPPSINPDSQSLLPPLSETKPPITKTPTKRQLKPLSSLIVKPLVSESPPSITNTEYDELMLLSGNEINHKFYEIINEKSKDYNLYDLHKLLMYTIVRMTQAKNKYNNVCNIPDLETYLKTKSGGNTFRYVDLDRQRFFRYGSMTSKFLTIFGEQLTGFPPIDFYTDWKELLTRMNYSSLIKYPKSLFHVFYLSLDKFIEPRITETDYKNLKILLPYNFPMVYNYYKCGYLADVIAVTEMELINGDILTNLLTSSYSSHILNVFIQLIFVYFYFNMNGYFHNDVKCNNIMVVADKTHPDVSYSLFSYRLNITKESDKILIPVLIDFDLTVKCDLDPLTMKLPIDIINMSIQFQKKILLSTDSKTRIIGSVVEKIEEKIKEAIGIDSNLHPDVNVYPDSYYFELPIINPLIAFNSIFKIIAEMIDKYLFIDNDDEFVKELSSKHSITPDEVVDVLHGSASSIDINHIMSGGRIEKESYKIYYNNKRNYLKLKYKR